MRFFIVTSRLKFDARLLFNSLFFYKRSMNIELDTTNNRTTGKVQNDLKVVVCFSK